MNRVMDAETRVSGETILYRDGVLDLLDQTRLPVTLARLHCTTVAETHEAIRRLVVRGAPAIGIAAAYGVLLAGGPSSSHRPTRDDYAAAMESLATSRPTAVNLFWALDRMRDVMNAHADDATLADRLKSEAVAIHEEDRDTCRRIGRHGAELLRSCANVLTHCNAGGLATSMWGTALAPIYHLHAEGRSLHVYADETRPLLQGARLTAWELVNAGVPVTVLTDSMSGGLMRRGGVDAVIVGADRIAANGDVANKIGTYPLAVLAKHHGVPFYVAAPTNTFDVTLDHGDLIPIEQRDRDEVARPGGVRFVPEAAQVINPAFDVTPADLIAAIVTERGVIRHPDSRAVAEHLLRPA